MDGRDCHAVASVDFQDSSYDVDVEWMRQPAPGPSRGFGGLRGRRRGSRGSPRRLRRRRGALMAGDVEHMVVDADWAPHGGYQDHAEEYGHMLHDMQGNEEEYDPGSSPSGMFVRKRERTQNWSLQEKLLLFRLVAPRLDVLENRRIDAMSSARKGRAWREIHELFSARYGPERDVFRIREQWRRMKQAAKADVAGKNPQKSSQSPAAAAVAAAVAAATGQVHIPPSPALAQSLMMPPTAANLVAQQQQQVVLQQQQAAVAAAAAAATATTRNQMNSVLSDMIVKALEKAREREQEGGGPFDLSELDDGMGLGGFFSSGMADPLSANYHSSGMGGGSQQGTPGTPNNSQLDNSHGSVAGMQGSLSGQTDNNPSGSATSSGGSNDAWRLTIVPSTSSSHQQPNNRLHTSEAGHLMANNPSSEGNGSKVNVKKEDVEEDEEGNGEEEDEEEGEEEEEDEGEWQEGDDQGSSSRQGRSDGQEGEEGEEGEEEEGGGDEEGEDGMEMVEPDVEMEEGKGTFMIMEMRRREHQRRMQIMEREHELRCEVLQVEREAAIIRRETAISERERGWKTVDDLLRCVGAWPREKKESPE